MKGSAMAGLVWAIHEARRARLLSCQGHHMKALDHLHWALRYWAMSSSMPRPAWMTSAGYTARVLTVSMCLDVCQSAVRTQLYPPFAHKFAGRV